MGQGALHQLAPTLQNLDGKRAVIITDRGMADSDWVGRLEILAAEAGVTTRLIGELQGEPTTRDVDAALEAINTFQADVVIGFGGGSALDTAKVAAVLRTNGGTTADYEGYDQISAPGTPVVAIPTTAGTGSEVTRGAAITDEVRDVKMLLMSPHLIPAVAIVDPEPTQTMPSNVTASTGLDALTHGIEAYVSRRRYALTDALAIDAIARITEALPRVYVQPDDIAAREEMSIASLHAGLAFNNASVALVHGMSRPIGAYFHVPHGLSNAMLLPTVMAFSISGNLSRYARVAQAMGAGIDNNAAAAETSVQIVRDLVAELEVLTLREWGVNEHEFRKVMSKMAHDAIESGSPSNNPRTASHEEIVALYEEVISA